MDNRLLSLRKERGFSGVDVSEALEISNQYYYDLEKGKKRLNEDILIKLSNYYNISADYILGLSDKPDIKEKEPSNKEDSYIRVNDLGDVDKITMSKIAYELGKNTTLAEIIRKIIKE